MMEPVSQPKSSLLVVVVLAAVAGAYFFLLGSSDFPEPGANLEYDLQEFEELDNTPTTYEETGAFTLGLKNPRTLATAGDKIFVGAENVIAVYDAGGAESARYPISGTANCLAVAEDGTLYAGLRTTLLVLDSAGQQLAEWKEFTPRSYLTSIALDGDDVYVADAGNRVVLRFNRAGELLTRIGEKDVTRDVPGLEVPSPYLDIALNDEGELWVVNPGELGVERYRSDGSIVTSWYRPSFQLDGFPGCCNPTHIAFDQEGKLIASEKGLVRVKQFEVTQGAYEGLIASSKQFPGEQSLRDLTVDAQNRVLVLDAQQDSVRVFARKEQTHGTNPQPQ
jgi:DNA-binding beta-propeller fold protein YncE